MASRPRRAPPGASKLRAFRASREMTQGALAEQLGVSQSLLSQIETGSKSMMNLDLALEIEKLTDGAVACTDWRARRRARRRPKPTTVVDQAPAEESGAA